MTRTATKPAAVSTNGTNGHSPASAMLVSPSKQGAPEPEGFDLNATIRAELASSADPNPHAVAARVAKLIPEDELRDVLALVLVDRVRVLNNHGRYTVRRDAAAEHDGPEQSRWDGAGQLYARFLGQREHVADGEWKFLGDCTRDEVLAIAGQRIEQANATAAIAKKYQRLAAAMKKRGAAVVADLPETTVLEVLR